MDSHFYYACVLIAGLLITIRTLLNVRAARERGSVVEAYFYPFFHNQRFNLCGRPNMVYYDPAHKCYVVEKRCSGYMDENQHEIYPHEFMQLICYLYLVETETKTNTVGYLIYSNGIKLGPFECEPRFVNRLLKSLDEIRKIKQLQYCPSANRNKRCTVCVYAERCFTQQYKMENQF